ncbi:hypothetical protein QBC37DRAFT_418887 [Rhypophila decipiens]|uniref:Uncharacterized protein n=1 Tax=Rhypophila decipiens TaxID=261697 RepID=A0AAN6YG83_9PEZI|nr:hypothetical protein QBC37DRAFT_418887 [Rhypophila decipiens]
MMGRGLWSNHERSISLLSLPSWHLLLSFIAGLSTTQLVVAVDANPKSAFTFPDEDWMVFQLNDVVLVSYVSSFPDPGLYAWCKDGDNVTQVFTKEPAAGYNGTQAVKIDFTSEGNCWWNLRRIFDSPDGANGRPFKLISVEREGGPRTISPSALSTSTMTTTSATSTTPTGSTNPTNQPSNESVLPQNNPTDTNNSNSGGLSTGAAAGIGVAVGLVVLILLIAGVIFLRRWKSTVIAEAVKASSEAATPGGGNTPAGTPPYPVYASTVNDQNERGGGQQMMTQAASAAVAVEANSSYERLGVHHGAGQQARWENQNQNQNDYENGRYHAYPGGGQIKPPEEMDVERHTAEMEGDTSYGAKFQSAQYR